MCSLMERLKIIKCQLSQNYYGNEIQVHLESQQMGGRRGERVKSVKGLKNTN